MEDRQKADFRILQDGSWLHDGAPINRHALAKLFADRALKIDAEGLYWLQTPFEKYPVEVEDVPFIITDYDQNGEGVDLRTNMGDTVMLNDQSAWELRGGIPYVEVRGGLYARVGRAVLYNLIESFGTHLRSRGATFPLGEEVHDDTGA